MLALILRTLISAVSGTPVGFSFKGFTNICQGSRILGPWRDPLEGIGCGSRDGDNRRACLPFANLDDRRFSRRAGRDARAVARGGPRPLSFLNIPSSERIANGLCQSAQIREMKTQIARSQRFRLPLPPEQHVQHITQVRLLFKDPGIIELSETTVGAGHSNELVVLDIKELGQASAGGGHASRMASSLSAF